MNYYCYYYYLYNDRYVGLTVEATYSSSKLGSPRARLMTKQAMT